MHITALLIFALFISLTSCSNKNDDHHEPAINYVGLDSFQTFKTFVTDKIDKHDTAIRKQKKHSHDKHQTLSTNLKALDDHVSQLTAQQSQHVLSLTNIEERLHHVKEKQQLLANKLATPIVKDKKENKKPNPIFSAVLSGIVLWGDRSVVTMLYKGDTVFLRLNESIDGWRLVDVNMHRHKATFRHEATQKQSVRQLP